MDKDPLLLDLSDPKPSDHGVHEARIRRSPPPGLLSALGLESLPEGDNSKVHHPAPGPTKFPERISSKQWRALLDMFDDLGALALHTGRKLSTVRSVAAKLGWRNPNARPTPLADLKPTDVDFIRQQIAAGVHVAGVAASFGVHKATLYRFMKKHKIREPNPQDRGFCPDSPRVHVAYREQGSIRKAAMAVRLEYTRVAYILKTFRPDGTRR